MDHLNEYHRRHPGCSNNLFPPMNRGEVTDSPTHMQPEGEQSIYKTITNRL